MKTITRSIALALLAGTVSALAAQQTNIPSRGPIPFAAFDQNRDGVVTEQEYLSVRSGRAASRAAGAFPQGNAANAPSFSQIDTDGDNRVTPDELTAIQQARQQQRLIARPMGTRPCRRSGPGMGRNRPDFSTFDMNNDGVIVEDEFYQAHDNRVAERARQGYRLRGLAQAHPYTDFDRDGDGKVTPQEFAEAQARHWRSRVW